MQEFNTIWINAISDCLAEVWGDSFRGEKTDKSFDKHLFKLFTLKNLTAKTVKNIRFWNKKGL